MSTDSDTPTHLHGDRVVVLVVESHVPLALVRVQLPFVRHLDQVSRTLRHSRLRPCDTNTISLDCLKAFGVTDHEISRSQARRTKENSLLKVKTIQRTIQQRSPWTLWLLFYGFVHLGRDNHFLQYEHESKRWIFPRPSVSMHFKIYIVITFETHFHYGNEMSYMCWVRSLGPYNHLLQYEHESKSWIFHRPSVCMYLKRYNTRNPFTLRK